MIVKKLCALAALLMLFHASTASAKAPETFPLSKVKRGLKGYGLTTMEGTTPSRFEFEVVGVVKNFLPKLNIILVKSDDPQMQTPGFWQGMSGSPLYVDGKLMCAFSYGFRFNKKPIGGCTPIEYMKHEGLKARRKASIEAHPRKRSVGSGKAKGKRTSKRKYVAPQSVASLEEWLKLAPHGDIDSAFETLGPARKPWLMNAPLPPAPQVPVGSDDDEDDEAGMVTASVPLALSGFTAPAFKQVKEMLSDYPVSPMKAGGTGDPTEGPTAFKFGSAISVQLLRGDMSAAGTGTVSYVDGDKVLAFGHPMFGLGEHYAPVATAEIHTVIPSAFSAFIVASPLREIGTLVQDRKSTIAADTGLATRMIPVNVHVDAGEGKFKEGGDFNVEMFNNRFFTGMLGGVIASNAVQHYVPDRDRVTAKITSRVKVKGYKALQFTDYLSSSAGPSSLVSGTRGLRVLVPLLTNPFEPVELERVDVTIKVSYNTNFGNIYKLQLPTSELKPGKRSYVIVTMKTYDGDDIVESIPFDVPASLAGSIIRLEVTAGDQARLDAAPAKSVDDMMKNFRKLLPGNVFAVTLYSADEGVALDGKLVRDLPASALDKIKTETDTGATSIYRAMSRSTSKYSRVINGKKTMLVKVADLDD